MIQLPVYSEKDETFQVDDNRAVVEFMNIVKANEKAILEKKSKGLFKSEKHLVETIYDELMVLKEKDKKNAKKGPQDGWNQIKTDIAAFKKKFSQNKADLLKKEELI